MPSVKSYQNRKKDIELLEARVRVLEGQLLRTEREYAEYAEYQKRNAANCSKFQYENQVLKAQVNLSKIVSQAENQVIDALHNKVTELERKVRIYRDYIRHTAFSPEPHVETPDVPACLKPLDVLTWHKLCQEYEFQNMGKIGVPNGLDNISQ